MLPPFGFQRKWILLAAIASPVSYTQFRATELRLETLFVLNNRDF